MMPFICSCHKRAKPILPPYGAEATVHSWHKWWDKGPDQVLELQESEQQHEQGPAGGRQSRQQGSQLCSQNWYVIYCISASGQLCIVLRFHIEKRYGSRPTDLDWSPSDTVNSRITLNFDAEVVRKWWQENRATRVIQNQNEPGHHLRNPHVLTR